MPLFPISGDVIVVRIPELPEEILLANEDKIPIWHASTNVTESVTLQTLRSFIETGSGGTYEPIYSGGSIIYVVPASADGGDTISLPSIAGYEFKLRRDAHVLLPGTEFLRLDAGGAKILDQPLIEGQRFEFDVFELYNGAIPPPSGLSSSSGFILGSVLVNTNHVISVNDINKVFQMRGGSNALEITLPDVDLCPENSFVIIETIINNTKQHKIQTTGGQYIYLDNESKLEQYIGKGEKIWCYRTDDGWYVIVDKGNFSNLGIPIAAYKAGLNQVKCEGQELSRTEYPRMWAYVQTLGASLVSDADWNIPEVYSKDGVFYTSPPAAPYRTILKPFRGCFSLGNGSTTYRIPDLQGMTIRGLLTSDTTRYYNNAGGFQRNEIESHQHKIWGQDNTAPPSGNASPEVGNVENAPPGGVAAAPAYFSRLSGLEGDTETRVDNIGLNWYLNY